MAKVNLGSLICLLSLSVFYRIADLVGFTSWASVREPSQVFTLLELIYHAWDTIAQVSPVTA